MFPLKCTEHAQRGQITISSNVSVGAEMKVTTKRESFLRNKNNKIQLIEFLCQKLNQNLIATSQSEGDADILIVKTAIDNAR